MTGLSVLGSRLTGTLTTPDDTAGVDATSNPPHLGITRGAMSDRFHHPNRPVGLVSGLSQA